VGGLFALESAFFGTHQIAGVMAGGLVQPAGEVGMCEERTGFVGKQSKRGLSGVFAQLDVAAGLAVCGEVDEVEVPAHELAEGIFSVLIDKAAEQRGIIIHRVSKGIWPPDDKTAQEKFEQAAANRAF
jgi:hypothetical protein